MPKFGWLPSNEEAKGYEYPHVWCREKTTGPDRLVIAPKDRHVNILKQLAASLTGPYLLLYILVVSRCDSTLGRYQSQEELSLDELNTFLTDYADYLEGDGRHHLWISSLDDDALLVYDNHNVIYAYGPLDTMIVALRKEGLADADQVRYPVPHEHFYNSEFDDNERAILQSGNWLRSDLKESDN